MMRDTVITLATTLILVAALAQAVAAELSDGDILISRDSSEDMISYSTRAAQVQVRREDSSQDSGSQYLVEFTDRGHRKISFRYDATPQVEVFEIVDLDVTNEFCSRDIAVVTIREYTNVEEPRYLYTRVFLELTQPGKGFSYLDAAATEIGGPTPAGLLEDYSTIDCKAMPAELTDKPR